MAGSAYFILSGNDDDRLGSALASAGNFDGGASGIQEFVIGSSGGGTVGATIYSGADSIGSSGIDQDAGNLTSITFTSSTANDESGSSVWGGFDFNGDGVDDVAIASDGKVFIIYGGSSALGADLTEADLTGSVGAVITNAAITADSVLSSVNMDGDAYDELVIGNPTASANAGQVIYYEYNGSSIVAGTGPTGEGSGDGLGSALTGLTDINGDGREDFAIGAPGATGINDEGKVYVVFGTASGNALDSLDLSTLNGSNGFVLQGDANTDLAGYDVASAGDFNGDGVQDLIVSAIQNDSGGNNAGEAYVIFGKSGGGFSATIDLGSLSSSDGITITGPAAGANAGIQAIGVGDASGDGIGDLLIAADDGAGGYDAYLVYGAFLTTANVDLSTFDKDDGFKFSGLDAGLFATGGFSAVAAALGDINNDGIADFALAAPEGGDAGNGTVLGILGGLENLKALDGDDDGEVDLSTFIDGTPPDIDFVSTNDSVVFSGSFAGSVDLRLNETSETGVFAIDDPSVAGDEDFDTLSAGNDEGIGTYGNIEVSQESGDDERWTYRLNAGALTALQFLGAGETVADVVTLTASNGRNRDVTITIFGEDDATEVTLTPELSGFVMTEDFYSFSGTLSVDDPDQNDNPNLAGAVLQSANGRIEISQDGSSFTFFLEDDLQSLGAGQTQTETFSGTFNGVNVSFDLDVQGRNENPSDFTNGAGYTLPGSSAEVYFGAGSQNVIGTAGDDRIDTGAGNDTVSAGAGDDVVTDAFGNDRVTGGTGDDNVSLLSGSNTITDSGSSGDSNYFKGGIGQDTITGGSGDDVIDGDAVSSILGGNDRLDGAGGDDLLRGGMGADTFVFNPSDGNDTIADFDGATYSASGGYVGFGLDQDFTVGIDQIELSGFSTITTAQAVLNAFSDVGGNATFSAEGTVITLEGVLTADLTVDEFILA